VFGAQQFPPVFPFKHVTNVLPLGTVFGEPKAEATKHVPIEQALLTSSQVLLMVAHWPPTMVAASASEIRTPGMEALRTTEFKPMHASTSPIASEVVDKAFIDSPFIWKEPEHPRPGMLAHHGYTGRYAPPHLWERSALKS
jgi:hypothetical protein